MADKDLPPDFRDLLSALGASSAEYLVVGGWAVGVHSEPRFTKDLDLLIGQDNANLERVASALQTFGAPVRIVDQLRALRADEFIFLGSPPARVDLLRTIPGVDFDSAYARRLVVDWDGVAASVLGREDLLASKRAAGRPKDLQDARSIERAARQRQPPRS